MHLSTYAADINNIISKSNGKSDDAAPGLDKLAQMISTIRAWGLIACIVAIIVAALIWAWGSQSQNAAQATQGKKGIIVAIAAAALLFSAEKLVEWAGGLGLAF